MHIAHSDTIKYNKAFSKANRPMNPLYFDANHLTPLEIKQHEALIKDILAGALRYPQIKKLKGVLYQGQAVYRAKINAKDRLIYTYVFHEGKNVLLILTVNNHNYDKLKRQFSSPNTQHHSPMELGHNDKLPETLSSTEQLTIRPTISYKGKTLVLNEDQQQARLQEAPLILLGPPGAGKTSILYTIMLRNLSQKTEHSVLEASSSTPPQVLFLSPSDHLIRDHKKLYQADWPEAPEQVVLTTWHDLLQTHYPDRTAASEALFTQWLKDNYPQQESSKIIHYELSLIAALETNKYRNLGQRQCYYSGNKTQQEHLITLLAHWNKYLVQQQLFDPMVTALNPTCLQHYAAAYLDEAQNLPPIALSSLMPRVLDRQFFACLDSEQCLLSSPYIHSALKNLLHEHYGHYSEQLLSLTWRCPPKIIQAGNQLMNAKYALDGNDKRRAYRAIVSERPEEGVVSWIDEQAFTQVKAYGPFAGTVVIASNVTPEERLLINQHLGTNNILSAEEAIGLDFDTVIIWNPFSQQEALRLLAKKEPSESLSLDQWNAINALYVALTRAQERLFFYDKEIKRWSVLANKLLGPLPLNQIANQPLHHSPEEERKKWLAQAEYHMQEGRLHLAQEIMATHLNMSAQNIEQHINTTKPIPASPVAAPSAPTPISRQAPIPVVNKPLGKQAKTSSKATPSNAPNAELTVIKKLVQSIQGGDSSAIKKLLEHPNAERYLFETPSKDIGASLTSNKLFAWLIDNHLDNLRKTLKKIIVNLEKSKPRQGTDLPFMNLLCKTMNDSPASLLTRVVYELADTPKLISFIKKHTTKDNLTSSINAAIDDDGTTLAIVAVQQRDIARIKILKELGANLDSANKIEGTPAYIAANQGQAMMLKALIELGAKLDNPTNNGSTLAHIAAQNGHTEVLKVLKKAGVNLNTPISNGATPAFIAAQNNRVEVLKVLKELGADLDIPIDTGATPAYVAAQQGHIEALKVLKELGANLDTPDNNGAMPAHVATYNGRIDTLKVLKNLGANLDALMSNGPTPVLIAAQQGNIEALKVLKELGANLDAPDNNGETPAYIAAQEGDVEALKILKELGANLDTPNNDGETPAYIAAQEGHIEALKVLKELGANLDTPDNKGTTPALIAAHEGHIEILKVLKELGANLDITNFKGTTPACIAAQNGHTGVLKILKILGANLNIPIKNGATPAYIAAENGQIEVLKVLKKLGADLDIPNNNGATPAFTVAQHGKTEALKVLKELGANLDTPNNNGETPAYIAAQEGHIDTLKVLKELGADLNTPNNSGATPAFIAAQQGHVATLKILKELGANLDTPNNSGATPAYVAAENGHTEILKVLKELGANLDTPEHYGATPAYIAAQQGHTEAFKTLKELGANLSTREHNGATPALIAAQQGHVAILIILKEAGVNLDTPDNNGATPAFFAAEQGHVTALKILKELGANLDTPDNNGETPAYIAAENGNIEVFRTLKELGANTDTSSKDGASLLFTAAQKGNKNAICFLLENTTCPVVPFNINTNWLQNFPMEAGPGALLRAKELIQQKIKGNSGKQPIGIMPHEIAQIMGHQELVSLLVGHPNYQQKSQVPYIGFFGNQILLPKAVASSSEHPQLR